MQWSDSELFEDLFKFYYKVLKGYACKYVEDPDAAEDIVQDVFFELWMRRKDVNLTTQLRSYLFKSTFNKSLNYLKNSYNRTKVSFDISFESGFMENQFQSSFMNQEDGLLLKELNMNIKICIDKLPTQCKKIFILKHTYHLKNKEIAEQLNISVKAVEKQVTKALEKIRFQLKTMGLLSIILLLIVKLLC